MADIRHALPSMPEPDKSILQFLLDYYENMKALEKDPHRGGKQATCIVMAMSDIKKIFEPKEEKTDIEIKVGMLIKSKYFVGITEVLSINKEKNKIEVKISRSSEHYHTEEWDLEHTIWGFERGDYTLN
jgi:hypothetical protein